jgi:hypothetical protein
MKFNPRQNVGYYKNGNFASWYILPGLLCLRGKVEKSEVRMNLFQPCREEYLCHVQEKGKGKLCCILRLSRSTCFFSILHINRWPRWRGN